MSIYKEGFVNQSRTMLIDLIIYHVYGLTYDEVLIIDPNTSITREEYDNYKAD